MEPTARLFNGARCHRQVAICSHCDRGNRYCGRRCARAARRESLRAAGRRYQNGRRGRHRHAARQRRYRQRREKVTHQGSPAGAGHASLPSTSSRGLELTPARVAPATRSVRCHFCGRVCSVFVRLGVRRDRVRWRSTPPRARRA